MLLVKYFESNLYKRYMQNIDILVDANFVDKYI